MFFSVRESDESIQDVINLALYIKLQFKNEQAAENFVNAYDREAASLRHFPRGYRGINIEYRGYEIRIKPFNTYNIFFTAIEERQQVIILRVLKDRQNWNHILRTQIEYHFS